MSIIDTINNARNVTSLPTQNTVSSANPAGQMDQNDFLRLMTTQLTTQDPFNPVDNTQMVAQMAQFSQVAGIAEMNQSLQRIATSLGGSRLSDAASWIGHSMLVESDIATPLRDGTYAGEFSLPEGADTVLGSIRAAGRGSSSRRPTRSPFERRSSAVRPAPCPGSRRTRAPDRPPDKARRYERVREDRSTRAPASYLNCMQTAAHREELALQTNPVAAAHRSARVHHRNVSNRLIKGSINRSILESLRRLIV